MNLYIRYFNDEFLAHNIDEAVNFLTSIDIKGFEVDDVFLKDLRTYMESDTTYPKRYKIQSHMYFIVIKTTAETMEEFKMNNNNRPTEVEEEDLFQNRKKLKMNVLTEVFPGWYDGTLIFKRVIAIPGTNKFQYKDTRFRAICKANSPLDCYERIVMYLKSRADVDMRSQYPSAKGRNFTFAYLGNRRPADLA